MTNETVYWSWPTDFPENCPPLEAFSTNGTYYRIVKNDPPEASDFVPVYRQNQKRAEGAIRRGYRTQCETMGLSVFADRTDAVQCAEQYPKIGDKIASISLTPRAGMIIQTTSPFDSHNTGWMAEDFEPTAISRIVAIS